MWDEYVYVERNRRSPEDSTIDVADIMLQEQYPGGCLNVAANIASLAQIEVSVSAIMSHTTWRNLYNYNIRPFPQLCSFVHPDYELIKTRLVDFKTKKQIIRIDNHKMVSPISADRLQRSYELNYIHMKRFDAIVISDYNKGTITPEIIAYLEALTEQIFVIDTKNPDLSIWNGLRNAIIKINSHEWKNIKHLCDKDFDIIVTESERGVYLPITGHCYSTTPVANPNVIGAGDAFLAGLVVEYLQSNYDLDKAIKYANIVAGEAVKHFGTHVVKPSEVKTGDVA